MKFIRKYLALALAALMALVSVAALAGCSGEGGSGGGGFPANVGGVVINSQPKGVAVVSDSLADVVLALGYEGQLKAKSESCTQEELSVLPNVSIDDAGAIAGTGANVVLTDSEPTAEQRAAIEAQGMQIVVLAPATNRETFTELYVAVGTLFQGGSVGAERGKKVSNSTLMTLDDIQRSIPERSVTPTACYLYDLGDTAVTGDTFAGMLFDYAGLINVFDSGSNNSMEGASITAGNPQYIFCATGLKDEIMASSKFRNLSAVRKNRVYEIDASTMNRQGGTVLTAVIEMAGHGYPELMEDGRTDKNDSDILSTPVEPESSKPDKKTDKDEKNTSKAA